MRFRSEVETQCNEQGSRERSSGFGKLRTAPRKIIVAGCGRIFLPQLWQACGSAADISSALLGIHGLLRSGGRQRSCGMFRRVGAGDRSRHSAYRLPGAVRRSGAARLSATPPKCERATMPRRRNEHCPIGYQSVNRVALPWRSARPSWLT
jgi:hypothetical protein